MKRFLLLFCTVVLVCSIMVVPALATSDRETITFSSVGVDTNVLSRPTGLYKLLAYDYDGVMFYQSPVLNFDEFRYNSLYNFYSYDVNFDNLGPDAKYISFEISFHPENNSLNVFVSLCDPTLEECSVFDDFYSVERYELVPVVADPEPVTGSIVDGVAQVFGGVGTWIAGQLGTATSLFWNVSTGTLTFLGVLGVAALALAVILLVVYLVVRFIRFRG